MKHLFAIVLLLVAISTNTVVAQEIRCNISINASKITGSNREIFQSMQMDLYEFVNNRKWTNHKFANHERIQCSFNIQITKQIGSDEFEGTINVQSRRPVFGSSYETTILNIQDEFFRCRYQESQTIEFNETTNKDNLTNIIAYYVYMVLGFDYDTFSPEGGTEYFNKAKQIVANSQNATERGWKSYESDYNRYWLVDNMLNKQYAPYRQALYKYHRQGLDLMSEQAETGRSNIAESLRDIQKVFRVKSRLYITQAFFDSKSNELISIFSEGMPDEKDRVVSILSECDPSNSSKYSKIKETTN